MSDVGRNWVYISESRSDGNWSSRLRHAIGRHPKRGQIEVVDHILTLDSTETWEASVEETLHAAKVAVLLISPNWLASPGAIEDELPRIQSEARQRGLPVFLVPLSRVALPEGLRDFAWASDPEQPLDSLKKKQLADTLKALVDKIVSAIDLDPPQHPRRIRIPDIAWVEIPGGPFIYKKGERRELPTFWMAKYPITNIQYQTFVDDGGYEDERWWEGLKRSWQQKEARWLEPNRPRTNVNWFEAVAFSRWLCARLGIKEGQIRLPTQEERERTARGIEGFAYPWGHEFLSGYANVAEKSTQAGPWYLEQTTAVGMYPHGCSPEGVEDLAGTVWEWCLSGYDKTEQSDSAPSDEWRIVCGGSWDYPHPLSRGDGQSGIRADDSNDAIGFRLLATRLIASSSR